MERDAGEWPRHGVGCGIDGNGNGAPLCANEGWFVRSGGAQSGPYVAHGCRVYCLQEKRGGIKYLSLSDTEWSLFIG